MYGQVCESSGPGGHSELKNQVSLTWAEFKLVHEIGHFSFSQLSCSVLEDNRDNEKIKNTIMTIAMANLYFWGSFACLKYLYGSPEYPGRISHSAQLISVHAFSSGSKLHVFPNNPL